MRDYKIDEVTVGWSSKKVNEGVRFHEPSMNLFIRTFSVNVDVYGVKNG